MTAAYASADDLKRAMQQGGFASTDDADDELLQDALDAATDWLTQQTGRVFGAVETEARDFYADDPNVLHVVDVATITAIAVDSNGDGTFPTTLTSSMYEIGPLDVGQPGVLGGGASIRIVPTSTRGFAPGRKVRVNATWGYGSVPVRIKLACVRLAQRWFKLLRDAPLGVLQGPPDLGTFQSVGKTDPMLAALLDGYVAAAASTTDWVVV